MIIDQEGEIEERQMQKYLRQKAEILQNVESFQSELEAIKLKKNEMPKRIEIKPSEDVEGLLTAVNDPKQLMDTIKMIGYRSETSMCNQIKPYFDYAQ